jgi:hypothetical protein
VPKTQRKRLQHNVKLDPLPQEQIDVAEDEIHYEHERYYRDREQEGPEVVAEDVALEDHRDGRVFPGRMDGQRLNNY